MKRNKLPLKKAVEKPVVVPPAPKPNFLKSKLPLWLVILIVGSVLGAMAIINYSSNNTQQVLMSGTATAVSKKTPSEIKMHLLKDGKFTNSLLLVDIVSES